MTITKLVLFGLFAALLGLLQIANAHATSTGEATPSIVMQKECPAGWEWSEEKERCVRKEPRGSY